MHHQMVGYSAYPRVIDFARMRQIAGSVRATMVTDRRSPK
jgi:glycine/serine hydroxymethyltransferase